MKRRLILTAALTVCFGSLMPTVAHGQSGRLARVNRPSDSSASARLGWTGGFYTRQYQSAFADAAAARGTGLFAGGDLRQPNYFGAVGRAAAMPPPPLPQAFLPGRSGYVAYRSPSAMIAWIGEAKESDIAAASGLVRALQPTVPLMGPSWSQDPITLLNRPYRVPQPEGTAFHVFFGLKPTRSEGDEQVSIPADGVVGLLNQQNEEFLQGLEARAFEAFKLATTDREDRDEQLSKARGALRTVRDQDREAYIPSLLLLHTALERNQVLLAMGYLVEAVRRHPTLFVENPDLGSYFGDPKVLERQARAYLRVGDQSPHPMNYALQAYCAWVLDDHARAKHAIERMMAEEHRVQVDADVSAIRYALAAAMN